MIFFPFGFVVFILILVFSTFLIIFWFLGSIPFAFAKLGISPYHAVLLYFLVLAGSVINIPITRRREVYLRRFYWFAVPEVRDTILAINLGGAIIPTAVSIYLLTRVNIGKCLIPLVLMIFIAKAFTRVIPGRGFAMPALIPPLFSALLAYIFYPENPAVCAYITGTLGVLIGADLLNLHRVKELHSTFVSIGGAGVFDGIFLTGLISALLS